ncbi:MAG TPA: L-histidine N(alpha)-methyltransferase [Gemmatimonadales bacterium]|jgi:L-histidine N-alpha-methyltransferase|nr:L-histidine N(alpha)-methyltransferase [Gemmatimonadales bacterium]
MPNLARTRSSRPVERIQNPGMLAEVAAGLSAPQKELSPKYFYDERGSELFAEITRLPEYYPTRTERALLQGWMPELMAQLGTRTLIELGAGNAEKSRIILDAMRATGRAELYVPIDVSATFLSQTAATLRREYPGLAVEPAVADIAVELNLPRRIPRPALFAFLGSTIGNFYPPAAIRLLRRICAVMEPGDRFLLGVDLRKDIARVEAAYNDSRGITAAFNRNMLLVLNHELGADFDPEHFQHRAFYDRVAHRIEMHLVSTRDQVVSIPGLQPIPFAAGESIRTEISTKYDRDSVAALFEAAGLRIEAWPRDPTTPFGLVLGAPA